MLGLFTDDVIELSVNSKLQNAKTSVTMCKHDVQTRCANRLEINKVHTRAVNLSCKTIVRVLLFHLDKNEVEADKEQATSDWATGEGAGREELWA